MQNETAPLLGSRYATLGSIHSYINGERLRAREAIHRIVQSVPAVVEKQCLCEGLPDDEILVTIDRWGIPISAVLCKRCGLVRLNPRWTDETYINVYKDYFWPLQTGSFTIDRKRFELSVERAAFFADTLQKTCDIAGKKVVEIGCSYGAGLTRLKNAGADLVGYDYDERIISLGREYSGLDLRSGGLEGALRDGEKFDLVILKHVFEHFLDPVEEGRKLKNLLKKDGRLFIEVPGIFNENLWQPDPLLVFNVFHTYYYSYSTLAKTLRLCGFVSDSPQNESIISCWRESEDAANVSWHDPAGVSETLRFLLQKEEEREKRESAKRTHIGFMRKLVDYSVQMFKKM